ncbi:MAG: DUF1385 domain-containing protein [archaeon]
MENVGGQAVIEGVMMKAKDTIVTAVRKPTGEIVYQKKKFKSLTKKPVLKWPFIRGIVNLIEMLVIGIKSLNYSTDIAMDEEGTGKHEKLSWFHILITIVLSLGLALVLFKFVPLLITQLLNNNVSLFENRYIFNITEGLLKIMILVLYIYVISYFADIKRTFMYHGAEHKAVHCYESGKELIVKNCRKFSTIHPRCGTSFILLVLGISIIVYIFLPLDISIWSKYGLRLLLLPVIAGISYEVLKLSAKHQKNIILKLIMAPGLALQRLTTNEPTDDQIEVALFSLKKALK